MTQVVRPDRWQPSRRARNWDRSVASAGCDGDPSGSPRKSPISWGSTSIHPAAVGEWYPARDGANFPASLKKATKPHAGKEIHVVLDNLSTHTTPTSRRGWMPHPNVRFHFTTKGPSWTNQIDTGRPWFDRATPTEVFTRASRLTAPRSTFPERVSMRHPGDRAQSRKLAR